MHKIKIAEFNLLLVSFLLMGIFGFNQCEAFETIVEWNFPNNPDDAIADGGTEDNLDKVISVEGAENLSFDYSGKTTNSARATGWDGDNEKYWQIKFTSAGYKNLVISSKQKSSNAGPRDFNFQYKTEKEDDWEDIIDDNIFLKYDNFISGTLNQITLPDDCNNQELIYVRWIKSSDVPVNSISISSGGASNIDDIVVNGELIEIDSSDGDEAVCVKNSEDVKINEIFPSPEKEEDEFVELVNFGEVCVDLSGWKMTDNTNTSSHKYTFSENTIIEAGEIIFVKKQLYLNNDTDIVFLFDGLMDTNDKDEFIDKVEYKNVENNKSYSFDGENWVWTSIQTPGAENEFDEIEEDEFEGGEYNIRLNEIFPNPEGDEKKGEYVEIYNGESFAINLKNWILKDSSKTKFVFPEKYTIAPEEYLAIYRDVFKFSLNNSGGETVYLMDSDGNTISSASYDSAKENISYSFNGSKWNWSKYLTPAKENKFNSAPKVELKKVKSGYVGIPVYFEVKVKSKDKDDLRYQWDFDDGSRSYLQNANHAFKKTGTYKVKLTVDDGGEGVEKDFKIQIKKYPKESVEITRLLPNPSGNDTGEEWIEIRNNSAKEINLKGWKIATGQKNLINHSISDDVKIPAGAVFQITRENSLFFLNNKEANIELRYPDGKMASKISYKKDKIIEGEICQNVKGTCIWISPEEQEEIIEEENKPDEEVDSEVLGTEDISEDQKMLSYIIDENFIKENAGKYSKEENDLMKKIYQIRLSKNNPDKGLIIDLTTGESIVYQADNIYRFTHSFNQTHWAVELMEDLRAKVLLNN